MPVRTGGDPELIDKAAELLANASNPAILAGWGVIESEASPELVELARLLTAPVATTFRGKGSIPEDHELALGVSGAMGHDTANGYLTAENVDVLLAVGAGFSQQTTLGWKQNYGGQKIIQVDVDPQGMCRVYNIELGILGDAKIVLRSLVNKLRQANKARNRERLGKISKLKEKMNYYSEPVMSSDAVPIKPPRAISEIRKALPRDAIVLT
ncbi:MAG: acetolactate synthase large subunit, partial [Candidatus Bathyarchaeia archaeon]